MPTESPAPAGTVGGKGEWIRTSTGFRNFISANGSTGFQAEPGRYHLYVANSCPWAHRTLIFRKLKGLEDVISVSVVDWFLDAKTGWRFFPEKSGCDPDHLFGFHYLREVYELVAPGYKGMVTVPVLFDKKTKTIVNNESAEILRMLNSEFNSFCTSKEQAQLDLYPKHLQTKIDEINLWIYGNINDGVYRCGFADSQDAYNAAVDKLFFALDRVEDILSHHRYLAGSQLTEADIRLFVTLIRFDAVYHGHFKCNLKMIKDYPNIQNYVKEIYQIPAVQETVNFEHIKGCYYVSHINVNPKQIIPKGPLLDYKSPHNRNRIFRSNSGVDGNMAAL